MSDKPNFSLPERKKKMQTPVLLIIIMLGVVVLLQVVLVITGLSSIRGNISAFSTDLSAEQQKLFAQKLQQHSLNSTAAVAWRDYLVIAKPNDKEKASVWYTIGKIYQDAGEYEKALDAYYRSEAVYKRTDIKQDIDRRIQDCLELMGKFAALRSELSDRVGLEKKQPGDSVVAEIGPEKITKGDLDKLIEQQIEFQIAQYAAYMDQETLKKQKEDLFKRYAGQEGRVNMLYQYLAEESLYRKAREDKIADDPATKAMLRETERKVLSQQLISKQTGASINITETDLKSFYETQKGDYIVNGKQKAYEEVKNEVYQKLFSQKEREVQQKYIDELFKQYNVVIHQDQVKPAGSTGNAK